MDSVAVSRDYRNMKGALMIKAYEESGMSLRDWLQQNNVSKDKYYYWRRKLRDRRLDEIISGTEVQDVVFTEITHQESSIPTTSEPIMTTAAMINVSGIDIRISDAASSVFIGKLIEAASYAK